MEKEREQKLILEAVETPSAFAELFEEHFDKILRYSMYHTGLAEIARDITAETFFKALKNIRRYKITTAPFSSWLYRIAGNEIADYFRRNKQKKSLLEHEMYVQYITPLECRDYCQEEAYEIQQQIKVKQTFQNIFGLLQVLPHRYREVLILRFFEHKSNLEICEIINKKEGTVKSLLSRGVDKLRTACMTSGVSDPADDSDYIYKESN